MVWKPIRQEPRTRDELFYKECSRFHKRVTITGHYTGSKQAKTDL